MARKSKRTKAQINASYEKQNKKMRKENPGMGKRLTSGTNPRRVSFACRFAGMKGPMKKPNGEPTRKAIALKKWGFGSVGAASSFCSKNKKNNMKSKKKTPCWTGYIKKGTKMKGNRRVNNCVRATRKR